LFFFSFFKKRKENILLNKISQKRVSLELINVFLFVEIGDIYKSPNKISVLNKNINIALKNSILNKKKSQFCLKLTLKILSFFYRSSGKCSGLPAIDLPLGTPLIINESIEKRAFGDFARILVDVDLFKIIC
jgi:hypothetical protein